MFRRKEETATDSLNPAPAAPANHSVAHGSIANGSMANGSPDVAAQHANAQHITSQAAAPQAAAPQASASNASVQQPASGTYVPSAPITRTPNEPMRSPATAPSSGSYRPTPITEFNRGAARSTTDALRSSAPVSTGGTGFNGSAEKPVNTGKSNRRILTVGNDILLKGEIATCDRLVIEGRVEAKLSEVHTVEIAECGSFKGTAEVEDAEISGVFEGDLIVRNRLVIYAAGEVRGNISYGEIEIERGGRLTGQIKTVASAANAAKAKPPFENAEKRPVAKETAAA